MKGPFPGMDPWLEKHWGDVHSRLITYICDELQSQLPGNLIAQAEESVFVDTSPGEPRWTKPDVSVVDTGDIAENQGGIHGVAAQPIVVRFPEETMRWVEIRDLDSGNEVVTVVEVLSPRNKVSPAGRAEYRRKQREYFEAAINLVEIDLLRVGERILLAYPPDGIPAEDRAPYYVSVTRSVTPWARELYPQPLDKPLSNIAIPLRETDDDVVLPLQKLLDRCYEMGRYEVKADYGKPPVPALDEAEMEWAGKLLENWCGN